MDFLSMQREQIDALNKQISKLNEEISELKKKLYNAEKCISEYETLFFNNR